MQHDETVAAHLLDWYRKHARTLPWRTLPHEYRKGKRPDPYRVWISEIMLQQTTVATVIPRYTDFLERYPSVTALARADREDVLAQWAGLGYYARARNLHACARIIVENHGGAFPDTEQELRTLPGIGHYTAAAIASIAFDRPAVAVDANIARIVSRLFAIDTPLSASKKKIEEYAEKIFPRRHAGDFAQAMMDLGSGICRPSAPDCRICPLRGTCRASAQGTAEKYPVKPHRKKKPRRYGTVFILSEPAGRVLVERRPDNGLLGGMTGLPGTPWTEEKSLSMAADHAGFAPARTAWNRAGSVSHEFTHFRLELDILTGTAPESFCCKTGQQWLMTAGAGLPTVMKKALRTARKQTPP